MICLTAKKYMKFNFSKRNIYSLVSISTAIRFSLSLSTLFMLLLSEFQCTTSIWDSRWHSNLLLSISFECGFCHFEKGIFNTQTLYSTRFVKHHVIVVFCPRLAFWSWYYSISFLIEFVSNADEGERLRITWTSIFVETISPSTKCIETLSISDVINKSATVSPTIESVPEWLELFLTSCIPYLQSHYCIVY